MKTIGLVGDMSGEFSLAYYLRIINETTTARPGGLLFLTTTIHATAAVEYALAEDFASVTANLR